MDGSVAKDLNSNPGELTLDSLEAKVDGTSSSKLATYYDISDIGDPDTLLSTVLELTVEAKYDIAICALLEYAKSKDNYPQYTIKTRRYFEHCTEIIHAIRSKNNFPNLSSLPKAKQQEINDRIKDHYVELKRFLERVNQVELELRQQDSRSTVWVVKMVSFSIFFLLTLAFVKETFFTMGTPINAIYTDFMNWIMDGVGIWMKYQN